MDFSARNIESQTLNFNYDMSNSPPACANYRLGQKVQLFCPRSAEKKRSTSPRITIQQTTDFSSQGVKDLREGKLYISNQPENPLNLLELRRNSTLDQSSDLLIENPSKNNHASQGIFRSLAEKMEDCIKEDYSNNLNCQPGKI